MPTLMRLIAVGHLLLVVPSRAVGQAVLTDTLRLSDALRIAVEANPMLRAARASAIAAGERARPAGTLPDPELQLGLMNRMISAFGSSADPMTMDQLQVMQTLPWPGKLGNARRAARHGATAAEADADDQERMLGAQVRMVYYDLAAMDRALAVMGRTRTLLENLTDVTTAMYAVGSAVQQDALRAEVEVARMAEDVTRMRQDRIAAAARLNSLLGRSATVPIPGLDLPEPDRDLPPVDSLLARALGNRPALLAGSERVRAADATLASGRRELYPDIRLGIAYQRRPAFDDMVSVMVGVSLPIFAGARQLPMRRELAAMRDAAEAELESVRNETVARIVELRARAERDRNLARLYRTSILPQADAAVQAALSSYRVGRVPLMAVIDNRMTVNRYQIETYRLTADFHQAMGELEALTGGLP